MSEQANNFKLGVFVIVAVTLMLITAGMLGAGAFLKKSRYLETYFTESVAGLEVGAPVKYRGVTVGKVHSIGFAATKYPVGDTELLKQKAPVMVVMEFPYEQSLFTRGATACVESAVKQGFRVRTAQSGLVGGLYLEFYFVDNAAEYPPLQVTWTPEYPYVPATASRMEAITSAAERIANQLEQADIGKIIRRISDTIEHIDQRVQDVDMKSINQSVLDAIADVRRMSNKVNDLLDSPETQSTMKDLPEIAGRVKSAAKRIDDLLASPDTTQLLANLNSGAANAGAAASDLRKLAKRLDVMLSQQQTDIEQIIAGLRRTLVNTSELAEDAKQNPSRMIFGEPPPRSSAVNAGNGGNK